VGTSLPKKRTLIILTAHEGSIKKEAATDYQKTKIDERRQEEQKKPRLTE